MYDASFLNQHNSAQYLAGWLQNPVTYEESLEFGYRAASVLLGIERMKHHGYQCELIVSNYQERLEIKGGITLWTPSLFHYVHELSPAIVNLLRIQKQSLIMIAQWLGVRNVPTEHKRVRQFVIDKFPASISSLILEYYDLFGDSLRGYRNLDQHFYSIARHSFVKDIPYYRLCVQLPDQPVSLSRRTCTFEQGIHALDYCIQVFQAIDALMCRISGELGVTLSPLGQMVPFEAFTQHTLEHRTIGLAVYEDGSGYIVHHNENATVSVEQL
jgi:hypothetical protein